MVRADIVLWVAQEERGAQSYVYVDKELQFFMALGASALKNFCGFWVFQFLWFLLRYMQGVAVLLTPRPMSRHPRPRQSRCLLP
jgi:hypothetical protein